VPGDIGSEIARLCAAFGMTVLGIDARRASAPPGVKKLLRPGSLHAQLPLADFIIMTVPETPTTRGLISAHEFKLMKPSSYLINIGRGLNAEEMEDNPDPTDYIVHGLNTDPCLRFQHDTFDAVVITASIQYLTQPIEVFRDVNRILKPQGLFAVLFSRRMFPTKAIVTWRALNDQQHIQLVQRYFQHAGNHPDKGFSMKPYCKSGSPHISKIWRRAALHNITVLDQSSLAGFIGCPTTTLNLPQWGNH
jgi:SAM-dependent methyltransferase